jgi:hypothetical protein
MKHQGVSRNIFLFIALFLLIKGEISVLKTKEKENETALTFQSKDELEFAEIVKCSNCLINNSSTKVIRAENSAEAQVLPGMQVVTIITSSLSVLGTLFIFICCILFNKTIWIYWRFVMMLTLCNFFSALSLVCFGICLMHFLFFC